MKQMLLGVVIACSTIFQLNAQEAATGEWLLQIEAAKKAATDKGTPILMVFSGSDWCRPCIQMKQEVWNSSAFQDYAQESLVLLELDFPARKKNKLSPEQATHNEALAETYNPKGEFPTAVLIDREGRELVHFGYNSTLSAQDYVDYLKAQSTE